MWRALAGALHTRRTLRSNFESIHEHVDATSLDKNDAVRSDRQACCTEQNLLALVALIALVRIYRLLENPVDVDVHQPVPSLYSEM